MNTPREPTFTVEIIGTHTLKVSDLWPDGDAPENPSAADVLARLHEWRGTARLLSRLDYGVTLNGEVVYSTCPGEF